MKYLRFVSYILMIGFLILSVEIVKYGRMKGNTGTLSMLLLEAGVVLIISIICLRYSFYLRNKKLKPNIPWNPPANEIEVILYKAAADEKNVIMSITMNDICIFGRDINCTHVCFCDDMSISAQHCRLIFEDNTMFIEDLNSRNGTFINQKRLEGKMKLELSDHIQIGKTNFQISWMNQSLLLHEK